MIGAIRRAGSFGVAVIYMRCTWGPFGWAIRWGRPPVGFEAQTPHWMEDEELQAGYCCGMQYTISLTVG